MRGFYVTNDRNYTYVGVRGFGRPSDYNNRVLVLVNGHRYNDNVYDQALIGNEFPIDLALVDRIEVIRGPGSALYGTSAFFAVINVVLRPGGAVGGSESSVEVGSFDTYRLRTSYGRRSASGFDSLLSVSAPQLRRARACSTSRNTTSRRSISASTGTPIANRRRACSAPSVEAG